MFPINLLEFILQETSKLKVLMHEKNQTILQLTSNNAMLFNQNEAFKKCVGGNIRFT